MKTCAALMVAGMMLCGSAWAQGSATSGQQAPAAKTQKPAASGAGANGAPGSAAKTGTGRALVTDKDKQSYAIGMNVGKSLKQQPIDLDPSIVAEGLKDTLSGAKPALTDDEVKAVLTELQGEMRAKQEAMMQQMGSANKKEGDAFLAANKGKEGVVTLPSGLAVQDSDQGQRAEACGERYGGLQLPRHAGQWERIRQLVQARAARHVSRERRDQGMDGSAAVDAGGIEVAAFLFPQTWPMATGAPARISVRARRLIFDVELISIQKK